ncbi:MAG: hypothetical protein BGN96_13430 [Bacteroidales bacterium 45-6]|uniref:glycosyltransferase family 10 domain-containing protein n=1 Tax=uncultured Dysgonomonas sp. TaxID=206096 RepID=UPI00095A52A5|nr:glycosyltransferase family 10 [uncultured Dysgonomonas sp.]OJU54281.1 MAG: hypothetical protein BGN96_13430 [Bacteroidales bacterium 45-6]
MIYINVLTKVSYPTFEHQFDDSLFGSKYKIYENSSLDVVWDYVVVYEGCKIPVTVKCHEGGLLFISGEPPLSRVYPQQFVNQFDLFITTHQHIKHKNVKLNQLAINWHFGLSFKTKKQKYNFDQLVHLPAPKKKKLFSVVTSSKKMMPGHNYRQKIIDNLRKDFGDYIDFYGDGVNNVEYKADALLPYMFHISMENTVVDHYWSEKFADSFLGYTIPIYGGCPNVEKYFGDKGYFKFDLKDYSSLKKIIEYILSSPQQIYHEMFDNMNQLRDKILHEYNFYNLVDEVIQKGEVQASSGICKKTILPYEYCTFYKLQFSLMRIKRYIIKKNIQLKK